MNPFLNVFKSGPFCDLIARAIHDYVKNEVPGSNKGILYEHKLFEILSYVDPESPDYVPDLFGLEKKKEITYQDIYNTISSIYCNKPFWEKYRVDEIRRIEALKEVSVLEPNTDKSCRKCKMKKVFTYGIQARKADEATTQMYSCLNCGNFWKQN